MSAAHINPALHFREIADKRFGNFNICLGQPRE